MRRIIFFAFLMLLASVSTAFAQRYATEEQCVEAMVNGTAIVYTPGANNLFKPVNPATEVLTTLEEDECQQQIIDRSKNMTDFYWVYVPKGTQMVKEKNGLRIKRRYSCGNPVGERRQRPLPTPIPTPSPSPSPTPAWTPPPTPPPSPTPQSTPCVGCELYQITGVETKSVGWQAHLPTWKEALWAFAEGASTSALASNDERVKAALIGGGGSVGKTVLYNWVVSPDQNVLVLVINGTSYEVYRKKAPTVVMAGTTALTLDWSKGNQIFGRLPNGNICFTAYIPKQFTVSTMTVVYRQGNRTVNVPVKAQSQPPHPRFDTSNSGTVQDRPQIGVSRPTDFR